MEKLVENLLESKKLIKENSLKDIEHSKLKNIVSDAIEKSFKDISGHTVIVRKVEAFGDDKIIIETNDIAKDLKMGWLFEEFTLSIGFTDYYEKNNTLSLNVIGKWKGYRSVNSDHLFTVKIDLNSGKIIKVSK